MGYAFISYSTKNQTKADAINELLKRNNIDTWMAPGDIPAGSKYAAVITNAIRECSCFVLLLSNDSQASEAVDSEVELAALTFKKAIIPIELENVVLNDSFFFYLHNKHITPIYKIDKESDEIKNLLASVISLTGKIKKEQTDDANKPVKNVALKKIELTVWSPVNTDVYLNDKKHLVMKIDRNNGVDYNNNSINVAGEFELIFISNGFEKIVAFDSNLIENRLDYNLSAILSKKEITASYDRDEAIEQIREEATAYAYKQLSKVGTAEDIQLLSDELEKHSSMASKNENTDYLIAVCASALGELAVKFGKLEDVKMIFEVYENYEAKSSYGYMFEPIVKRLKDEGFWIEIDEAHFPDEIFRNYVRENFDTDKNGMLSQEEINAVTKIDISEKNCTSLKGIEYFTALETLLCSFSLLTSLDVSKNTALKYLDCSQTRLKSLDVGQNTALKVKCSSDAKDLTIIGWNSSVCDTASKKNLDGVAIDEAHFPDEIFRNYIKENFDTDKNGVLSQEEINAVTKINVSEKNCTSLKGVEYFSALTYLKCNNNGLTSIDIGNNTALETLLCSFNQLKSLDISKNIALAYLNCNNNRLTSLEISNNTALTYLNCNNNQLTSLDVSKNIALKDLKYNGNAKSFKLIGWNSSVCDTASKKNLDGVAIDEAHFPDEIFRNYVRENFDTDKNGVLSQKEINAVTKIDIHGKDCTSLKGIEYFTELTDLNCRNNKLTRLDVSKNIALTSMVCNNNPLTSFDVSQNTALTYLHCSNSKLTSLDVSKNIALTSLKCVSNQLTSLDVSKNIVLTSLHCVGNKITNLNVSNNTALTSLKCASNQLTSLDVSKNIALTSLHCDRNKITNLNVSKNTALTSLKCDSNQLTSLNVSKNIALTNLDCDDNQLTSLDVSKNIALETLRCSFNELTSLDVSHNSALEKLECEDNEFISIYVGKNTAITGLKYSGTVETSSVADKGFGKRRKFLGIFPKF